MDYDKISQEITDLASALGYDLATGQTGTGWMQYSYGDFAEEYPFESEISLENEKLLEFAEGWIETHQYKYEHYDKMLQIVKTKIGEDVLQKYEEYYNYSPVVHSDIITGFENGYLDAIFDIEYANLDKVKQYCDNESQEICKMNNCDTEHYCESYAYIDRDKQGYGILSICHPSYFIGYTKPYANVLLPTTEMSLSEFKDEIDNQIAEQKEMQTA